MGKSTKMCSWPLNPPESRTPVQFAAHPLKHCVR